MSVAPPALFRMGPGVPLALLAMLALALGLTREREGSGEKQIEERFLLYDAKIGEGFNLQKEIFIRAAWLAEALNAGCQQEAASRAGEGSKPCSSWVVVLPPWCHLAHWQVPRGTTMGWGNFFDLEHMNTGRVSIMEYETYKQHARGGQDSVDEIVHLETFSPDTWTPSHKIIDCQDSKKFNTLIEADGGSYIGVYSGYCTHIRAQKAVCVSTWGQPSTFLEPILKKSESVSVLVKSLDHATGPYDGNYHTFREKMMFSSGVRADAEEYITNHLKRPYLGAHVRRSDFATYAHPTTTPSVENVAETIRMLITRHKFRSVFVATDSTAAEKEALKKMVPAVVFMEKDFGHPGVNAVVEQWICALSDKFVGTRISRFTLNIQEERDLLGISGDLTWNHFCKGLSNQTCYKGNWFRDFPTSKRRETLYGSTVERIHASAQQHAGQRNKDEL